MNAELIQKIPKVELHCHLDGSVSLKAYRAICDGLGDDFADRITAPVPCGSLKEYLTCFDVALPQLQTARALEAAAYDVIRQAAEDHVVYMEVRFAPGFHCNQGLDEVEACHAVLRGLELGERDFGVRSRVLVCLMRGLDDGFNRRTLEAAKELRGYGVAGVDLAGNEAAYPPELYEGFFEEAARYDLPITLHAGECGSSENVRRSIQMGARRIGHGVAIADDEEIKALCRARNICLEMCPISNLQTKAVSEIEAYPFVRMRNEGLCTTIHTDNRTVSGTSLVKEWSLLADRFAQVDEEMIRQANLDAARAAFLPDSEIRKILREMES